MHDLPSSKAISLFKSSLVSAGIDKVGILKCYLCESPGFKNLVKSPGFVVCSPLSPFESSVY